MLQNTFIHLPSIGVAKERALWNEGIYSWDEFLDARKTHESREHVTELFSSKSALHELNSHYFSSRLPRNEVWRTWPEFREKTAFLDIETTGLHPRTSSVTVIGLYDGNESRVFIKGKNLDEFPAVLSMYKSVITFNGAAFDLPFLKHSIPELATPPLHIDLRPVLGSLGYRGGLKAIEQALGLERDDDLAGLTGRDAVRLWRKYQKGDKSALDTLIRYNIADIENLKILMEFSYKKKKDLLGL